MRLLLANPRLRRVEASWLFVQTAIWAWVAALGVYVFERSGTTAVSLVLVARMLSGAVAASALGALADRTSRVRILQLASLAQAALVATAAVVVGLDAPLWTLVPLAAVEGAAGAGIQPAHRGLTPYLTTTLEELTAANALTETVVAVSLALGPAIAGIALFAQGPVLAIALVAGMHAGAALWLVGVRAADRGPSPAAGVWSDLSAGALAFGRDPGLRTDAALILITAGFLGVMTVYANPVAIDLLGFGSGGPALLIAMVGVGAVVGGAAVRALLGRFHLSTVVAVGLACFAVPVAAIGAWANIPVTFVSLVVVGLGMVLMNVTTVLVAQRLAPLQRLGAVLGTVAVLGFSGLGFGAVIGSGLEAAFGIETAMLVLAAAVAAAGLAAFAATRRLAERFPDLSSQLAALRAVPAFADLPVTTAESIARGMVPSAPAEDAAIVVAGERPARYYILEAGSVVVSQNRETINVLRAPDAFGEIALVGEQFRTATVRATRDTKLWSIDRDLFLAALASHSGLATEIRRVAETRLARAPYLSER